MSGKKTGLQIKVVSDEFDNEDIVCECESGRPQDGQTVIICTECRKWVHINCVLEGNLVNMTPARGFVCRPCQTIVRSAAAKRGYHKNKNEEPQIQKGNTAYPLMKSGTPDTPNKKVSQFASQRPRNENGRFLPISLTKSNGYSRELKDENSMEVDAEVTNIIVRNETEPKKKSSTKTKSGGEASGGSFEPLLEQLRATSLKVHCICEGELAVNYVDYILCLRCKEWQHKGCLPALLEGEIDRPQLCLDCWAVNEKIKKYQIAMELKGKWEAAKKVRDAKLRAIVFDRFWKEYCELPSDNCSKELQELTTTFYADGKMIPTHPAPQSWVDEMMAKISMLICPENKALVWQVNGEDPNAFSLDMPQKYRRNLNDLAVLTIHQGFLNGRKADLGVLLELLGMADKGTYWKGA